MSESWMDFKDAPSAPRAPEPTVSESAGPVLRADELDAKIRQRQREMETAPCYRCDHSPAAPDPGCPCCHDAHTPNADGDFTGATADEFATMREEMRP